MKSPFVACCIALGLTTLAAGAAPAPATAPTPAPKLSKWQQQQQEKFKNSAPADEYFGHMKMSYLGMNNTFHDSAISSGDHTTDQGIVNKVALAEDALEAWAKKYPHDPQLARTYYLATIVDRKIWLKANQERAWVYLNRLVALFPDSYFGKLMKRTLAIGFTEHYYALAVACATPTPAPTAPPDDAASAASATPAPTGTPSPAPTATPSPGPTETTLSKGHRVQIIPSPCVPPPTPAPTPTASAAPSPSASSAASPEASPVASPAASSAATAVPTSTP